MQTENPFLDGLAKLFTDAAGAAKGARAEFETFVKQRLEKLVADMDFVPREEFEAVKAMAAKARSDSQRLAKRVAVLERRAAPKKRRIPPTPRAGRKL
jgi:BMFP domain-containing protein YqiC